MRRGLFYGAVLIGAYIVAAYATNFGQLVGPTGGAAATVVKAFQGRN